jgi:basic membrane protein A
MRTLTIVAGAIAGAALFGCAPQAGPAAGAGGQRLQIGVVFDSGGLGDKSFNDSAFRGVQRAVEEFGVVHRHVESKAEKDYEENLASLAEAGMDLVIAVGLNQRTALEKVAPRFPDTKFAIVDAPVEGPNVRSLLFREEEGSFLAGYLAALTTDTKKLGFVGGMELDLIYKFYYGYAAGARMADPTVEVLPPKFTGDWNNVDVAKAAANLLFSKGADIVYHAAGRAGLGVIRAAAEQNRLAIGVDSDQDHIAPGHVLTSMIKRVDEAVYRTIKDVQRGAFTPGRRVYDLKANGVGLSEFRYTRERIGEANLARVRDVQDAIVRGEIAVPADRAAFDAFLAAN